MHYLLYMQAQKMVETIAEAFEVTFKKMEEKRAQREVHVDIALLRAAT